MARLSKFDSSSDDDAFTAASVLLSVAIRRRRKKKRTARVRKATLPYVLRRKVYGAFHSLVQELATEDPAHLRRFLRMSGETFDALLHLVGPLIEKETTRFKESIPSEERLAVTLHFLASGGPKCNLFYLFRIPVSTLQYLIPDTCRCIFQALQDNHLKFPQCEADWMLVQQQFYEKWHFPQCLGALDGKHVQIKCPPKGGSEFFNYLGFHSIVLFALVDANYRFIFVDVGAPGRVGDAAIWNASQLKEQLENGSLNVPQPVILPESGVEVPSLIVADSAFALSPCLMKPFPEKKLSREERLFNYRLSRARRVVENAFGILASRFGVYQTAMSVSPKSACDIVFATLSIHNFLRALGDSKYCGQGAVDSERGLCREVFGGDWRENRNAHLPGLQRITGGARHGHQVTSGKTVRDALKDYFVGPGALPWQHTVQ